MLVNRHILDTVFKQALYSTLQPTTTHYIKIPTSDMDWFSYKSFELIYYTYNCKCNANVRDGRRHRMLKFIWIRLIVSITEQGERSSHKLLPHSTFALQINDNMIPQFVNTNKY